jgi:hypothetical protein
VDVEQLYLHGFQFVGHANTNPDADCDTNADGNSNTNCDCDTNADGNSNTNCDCYTNTHSYTHTDTQQRCGGDDQPIAGFELYFVKRDFQLERGQRHGLLPFGG